MLAWAFALGLGFAKLCALLVVPSIIHVDGIWISPFRFHVYRVVWLVVQTLEQQHPVAEP